MELWERAKSYVFGTTGADDHMAGILQLELLKWNGLKPYHHVLEIGCGALVAGRPLMQYLEPNRYVGIDPNSWLIEACRNHFPDAEELFLTKKPLFLDRNDFDASSTQRRFDFILSHSVLSHAAHWQLPQFIVACAKVLLPHGTVVASIRFHDDNNTIMGDSMHEEWQYPGVTYFSVETVCRVAEENGLVVEHRVDYREFFTQHMQIHFHDWVQLRRRGAIAESW